MKLQDAIKGLTAAEYQKLIIQICKKNPDAEEVVFAWVDKNGGKKYTLEGCRKLVRATIKRRKTRNHIYAKNVKPLANELSEYVALAHRALAQHDFITAFNMAAAALPEVVGCLYICDDSSGRIRENAGQFLAVLQSMIEKPDAAFDLKVKVYEYLAGAVENEVISHSSDFLNRLHTLLLQSATVVGKGGDYLKVLDNQIAKFGAPYFETKKSSLVLQKALVLEAMGRNSEALKVRTSHINLPGVREQLIEAAIAAKEFAEAKKLCNDGIKAADGFRDQGTADGWRRRLLEIAQLENDTESVRQHAIYFTFAPHDLDPEYYQIWKGTYTANEWKEVIDEWIAGMLPKVQAALKVNRSWLGPSTHVDLQVIHLLSVYVEEGYIDQLLDLALKQTTLFALSVFHAYLAEARPAELAKAYVPLIIKEAEHLSSRQQYFELVQQISDIMDDIPEASPLMLEVVAQFRENYKRRPAFIEELRAFN